MDVFEFDLTAHEARRRAEVVAALGDGWDPVAVLRSEQEAYDLLYSGLDEDQRRTYAMLADAGVLPPREDGRAADRP
ncbi:DUF6400 family protein [Sphaerisporangium aureirubrum]|uniref:DUF6400 family protein n=1 Tax=Sphaerisporangium aureirubrum TaxID=1544736 RepID=A0ABW1NIE8_9ACTN